MDVKKPNVTFVSIPQDSADPLIEVAISGLHPQDVLILMAKLDLIKTGFEGRDESKVAGYTINSDAADTSMSVRFPTVDTARTYLNMALNSLPLSTQADRLRADFNDQFGDSRSADEAIVVGR